MPKKVTQTVIETKNEDNESGQDELLQKLDVFFEGISTGCTVGVYREQPKNLQSFLEEIEISDGSNPVDMEYLKNNWGGRVLKLIIRGEDGKFMRRILIPMRSYPPKMEGQVIPEWGPLVPNPQERQVQRQETTSPIEMFRQMNEILKSNAQPVSNDSTMAAIVVPLIQSLIERSFSQPQLPQSGNTSSLLETMEAMKHMRDFIAPQFDKPTTSDNTDGDGTNPMIMKLMDIGQAIVEKRSQPKQAMLQPQVQPPYLPVMPQRQVDQSQLSEMKQEKSDQAPPFTMEDAGKLKNFLLNLKGKEAASLFFETLQGLPVHEQEAAIKSVAEGLGFEEIDEAESNGVPDTNGNNEGNGSGNRTGNP